MYRTLIPIVFLLICINSTLLSQQFFDPNPNVDIQHERIYTFLSQLPEISKKANYYGLSEPVMSTILVLQSNNGSSVIDGMYNYARILPNRRITRFEAFSETHGDFVACIKRSRGIEALALALNFLRSDGKNPLSDAEWLTMVFGPGGDLEELAGEADGVYTKLTGMGFSDLGLGFGASVTGTARTSTNNKPPIPNKSTLPNNQITESTKSTNNEVIYVESPVDENLKKENDRLEEELSLMRNENGRLSSENTELKIENRRILAKAQNETISPLPEGTLSKPTQLDKDEQNEQNEINVADKNQNKVVENKTEQTEAMSDRIDFATLTQQSNSNIQKNKKNQSSNLSETTNQALATIRLERIGLLGLFRTPYGFLYEDYLAGGVLSTDISFFRKNNIELGGTFRLGYATYEELFGAYGQGVLIEAGPYCSWTIQGYDNGAIGLSFNLPVTLVRIKEENTGFFEDSKTAVDMPFWNFEIDGWKTAGHFTYGVGIGILPVLGTTVRLAYEF